MEYIDKYIRIINMTSKVFNLPIIKYFKPEHNLDPKILIYLIDLGYIQYDFRILPTDTLNYLVVKDGSFYVSAFSINYGIYDRILDKIRHMPEEDYLNMTDEELELLIRMS